MLPFHNTKVIPSVFDSHRIQRLEPIYHRMHQGPSKNEIRTQNNCEGTSDLSSLDQGLISRPQTSERGNLDAYSEFQLQHLP